VKGTQNIIEEYIWDNIVEFKLEGEFVSSKLENFNKIFVYLDYLRNDHLQALKNL